MDMQQVDAFKEVFSELGVLSYEGQAPAVTIFCFNANY